MFIIYPVSLLFKQCRDLHLWLILVRSMFDTFRFSNDVRTNLERTSNEERTENYRRPIENRTASERNHCIYRLFLKTVFFRIL